MIIHKIGLVLLIGLFGCNQTNKPILSPDTDKNSKIAKIRLVDFDGQLIHLEKYRGKTVFINFWATWCKPCIQEMPSIERAQNILRDKKVVFLMAAAESAEQTQQVRANSPYKFNYTKIENLEELNIQALPTTFIINPKGKLVFSEMGSRNWDDSSNINMILKITNQNE
jgi:thiol-disulfide isomerase/thioredoxin